MALSAQPRIAGCEVRERRPRLDQVTPAAVELPPAIGAPRVGNLLQRGRAGDDWLVSTDIAHRPAVDRLGEGEKTCSPFRHAERKTGPAQGPATDAHDLGHRGERLHATAPATSGRTGWAGKRQSGLAPRISSSGSGTPWKNTPRT